MVGPGTLLYMTAPGMTMGLLFTDSRFFRRRAILAVYAAMILVMTAVVLIHRALGTEAAVRLYTPAAHLPALLLFTFLSRCRTKQ